MSECPVATTRTVSWSDAASLTASRTSASLAGETHSRGVQVWLPAQFENVGMRVVYPAIKAITRGPWGAVEPSAGTWYEPLTRQEDLDSAVWFVLGHPGVFLNTVGDRTLLPAVLDAAERFAGPPGDDEIERLVERARMTPLFVS